MYSGKKHAVIGSQDRSRRARLLVGLTALGLCATLITLFPVALPATADYRAEQAEELVEACAVVVDGSVAVTVESEEAARELLDELRQRYETPVTESAAFRESVELRSCQVSAEDVAGHDGAMAVLDPESAGSPFALTVLTLATVDRVEAVPHESETVWIEDNYSDEIEITQAGADGEAKNTYEVIYRNGVEELATLTSSETVKEPVTEIVEKGALPGSRYDSHGFYIWPTTGVITSKFGGRKVSVGSSNHKGIDIGNSAGTQVVAADSGTVFFAGKNAGYGNLIQIRHDDGTVTRYAHLRKILVSEGDRVCQGQLIGEMGRTGVATGNHLHFEILPDGKTQVNPLTCLTGELQRY